MKKRIKKRFVKNKKITKKQDIKNKGSWGIILGIIIMVTLLALIVYLVFIKVSLFQEVVLDQDETKINIKANFEWRDPKIIKPYGGRFYDKCEDGTNLGKIWANIELLDQKADLSFTCKATTIVKSTQKVVDAFQLSLGKERVKSGFIGYTEELAQDHLIEICCKSKNEEDSVCKTFEFAAYC